MVNISTGGAREAVRTYLECALDEYASESTGTTGADFFMMGLIMGKLNVAILMCGGSTPKGNMSVQVYCTETFNEAGRILGIGDVYQLLPFER